MNRTDLTRLAEEMYAADWTVEDLKEFGALDLDLTADEVEEVAEILEKLSA